MKGRITYKQTKSGVVFAFFLWQGIVLGGGKYYIWHCLIYLVKLFLERILNNFCCRYRKFKVWNWRLIHRRNVFCLKLKCLNFPSTLSLVKRKGRGKFDEFRNVQLKAETRRVKTPLNSTTRYADRVLKSRDL